MKWGQSQPFPERVVGRIKCVNSREAHVARRNTWQMLADVTVTGMGESRALLGPPTRIRSSRVTLPGVQTENKDSLPPTGVPSPIPPPAGPLRLPTKALGFLQNFSKGSAPVSPCPRVSLLPWSLSCRDLLVCRPVSRALKAPFRVCRCGVIRDCRLSRARPPSIDHSPSDPAPHPFPALRRQGKDPVPLQTEWPPARAEGQALSSPGVNGAMTMPKN